MINKLFPVFILFFSLKLSSQKQVASPYSFFGIGNNFQNKTVEESMMGGIGTATSSPVELNFSNPASLSELKFTVYTAGIKKSRTTVSDLTNKEKLSIFSLSYLAIGIPLREGIAFSTGLRAKTGVGYRISNGDLDSGLITYEGSGGTNSMFLGGGLKIFKGLSIGLEGAFIFGNIKSTETYKKNDITYDVREKITTKLKGFDTRLGFYYQNKLSKTRFYSLGLVFLKGKDTNLDEKVEFYNGFFSSEVESINETLSENTKSGKIENPLNTTFSVCYGEYNKWQASVEYSFNNSVKYNGNALRSKIEKVTYHNYQRISIGGYYIPKFNSLTSYFNRVKYRAGAKYEKTGISIEGENINDLSISFGMGLPIGRGLSGLNIGFEFGKKGEINSKIIEEKYFNLTIGISFRDKWFRKRKID